MDPAGPECVDEERVGDAGAPPPATVVVAVRVEPDDVEVVADLLWSLEPSAVAEQSAGESAGQSAAIELIADLESSAVDRLRGLIAADRLRVVAHDPDWNRGWRAHAQAWTCAERVVLRPSWLPAEPPAEAPGGLAGHDLVEVLLDPGEAFGSGSHPTTRLCVDALVDIEPRLEGASVLDVGCGSGVLGIVAAKLGARTVLAVDTDPEAVRASREMVELNGVTTAVGVEPGTVEPAAGEFDVVLANLLAGILDELADRLVAAVAPGGSIVLSGVLDEQLGPLLARFVPLRLASVRREQGWVAATLVRDA